MTEVLRFLFLSVLSIIVGAAAFALWQDFTSPIVITSITRIPTEADAPHGPVGPDARGCWTIYPPPAPPGQGRGGTAVVCGEGACAQAGASGDRMAPMPTYCIHKGALDVQ